jgi:succinate dehydrogenase / fumarate reductase, cytochrome b subunit
MKVLSSSIGKKFVMGVTGLLLCGFLLGHLAGNLLMYVGPQAYEDYAHALHSREYLVKIAEAGLVVLFVLHIWLAFDTTRMNWRARRLNYRDKQTKIENRNLVAWMSPENWMLISGAIVLGFLLLHLADFTWNLRLTRDGEEREFHKAVRILRDPISAPVYILGSLVLGFHVAHGVYSAFRSIGATHPKYNQLIKWGGVAFAVIVALGFASFPIWAYAVRLP